MNILKKKSIFYSFFLILSMISLLFLTACDDISAEDMENYPESVQDETVSVKYYKQINYFYEEEYPMIKSMMNILNAQIDMGGTIEDVGLDEIVKKSNKRLNKYSEKPSTKADEEIEFQFEKVIYIQKEINDFEADILKGEEFDVIEAITLLGLMENVLQDFDNVVESYDIK